MVSINLAFAIAAAARKHASQPSYNVWNFSVLEFDALDKEQTISSREGNTPLTNATHGESRPDVGRRSKGHRRL